MATIDSAYTEAEATSWSPGILACLPESWTEAQRQSAAVAINAAADRQVVVPLQYLGFDGLQHEGQMVVDRLVANGLSVVFKRLRELSFPIRIVRPIVAYGFEDSRSMQADNSSGFNPRLTSGRDKRLSNHSFGIAIDINPAENPYVENPGDSPELWRTEPRGSVYNAEAPGTVTRPIATVFQEHGFAWGGDWQNAKDFQHFDFDIERASAELEGLPGLRLLGQAAIDEDFIYLARLQKLREDRILSR